MLSVLCSTAIRHVSYNATHRIITLGNMNLRVQQIGILLLECTVGLAEQLTYRSRIVK